MSLTSGLSVRAKAVLAATGTVAFAIALCMVALVLALQHNLRESAGTDARNASAAIESELMKSKHHSGKALIITPGKVSVRDDQGRMIASTTATDTAVPSGVSVATVDVQASTKAQVATESSPSYKVDVSPSTTAVDNATSLLLRRVAPAAAGLVLFVAALTWLLVGRALRPVAAIQREVTEITERDLHRRVPVPRARDEISRLARTMNTTLDRLQRAMTRQRQFVADASHELRSPIAAVRAQLELAIAHPSRTDWPTAVHKALRDTDRLQTVASDLLLLARLDAQEAPSTSSVDLSALAAEEARRHPGTAVSGSQVAVVTGSQVQLSRLLTNLADNARRHARSTVSITVGFHEDMVELTVDDDGPGIPWPDRERVFERFTRLDHARARQDGGTGLGLAIAKDITHAHGGTLTVHTSPWGGARMLVHLPRESGS